jgi:hypothetical protein
MLALALLVACAWLATGCANNNTPDATTQPANQRPYKSVLDWDTSPPG